LSVFLFAAQLAAADAPPADYVAAAKDKPEIVAFKTFERDKPLINLATPKPLLNADDIRDHAVAEQTVAARCGARGAALANDSKGVSPMDYNCGDVRK
jgi:hypothetical protein